MVTALALLRNQAQRVLVAALARNHVVVVGLGATGSLVARGLRRSGHDVVALELDSHSPRLAAARADGVRVIVGDGTSSAALLRSQLDRARHLIVLTADDSRNLEVAAVARAVLAQQNRTASTTLHVGVESCSLWKELDRLRLGATQQRVTTEYVNLADRTAQRVLAAATDLAQTERFNWVLVAGDTTVATRTIAHLVRRAVIAGRLPRIDLAPGSGPGLLERLRAEEPWCEEHADIRLPKGNGEGSGAAPLVLVCLTDDDAAAIAQGLVFARQMPEANVLVAVYREGSESTLEVARAVAGRVHLIAAKVGALGEELLERSTFELMARVRHEHYVAIERAKGATADTNSSLVSWEKLPDSLKDSNRRFALSAGSVIAQLGGTLMPLSGPVPDDELAVTPEMLERMAKDEHVRWMRELQGDGWTQGDGLKDPVRRTHPLLIPWEQLPESERSKDRDAFRALPHMLARVGYSLMIDNGSAA